jgi:lipopolysaccharide transport system permease protein
MLIFVIVLGHFGGLASRMPGVSYPLSVLSGLILWMFFSNAVNQSNAALMSSSHLITKVYFPRLIIPLAATTAALVDLAASFVILLVALPLFSVMPSARLLLMFPAVAGTFLVAAGIGAMSSALTIRYRDFRYVVPFGLQVWMFLTPVVYPIEIFPERWRWVLRLNPLTGLIESARSAVLNSAVPGTVVVLSLVLAVAIFVLGIRYFVASERSFADTI